MKKTLIIFFLLSSLGYSQTKNSLESQIAGLLYDFGTFNLQGSNNDNRAQQKSCSVTFNDRKIEILLTHHGDIQAIKALSGVDSQNSEVETATTVDKFIVNIGDLKLKQSGSLDFNLVQFTAGSSILYLNVFNATHQSFAFGEIHKKGDINNKINVYRYFNESGTRITKLRESFAQALITVPKVETKVLRIPLSEEAIKGDWFRNTLNTLFVKYLEPGRDVIYEYNESGTTISEIHLLNTKKHGYSTFYFDDGKPRLVEIWKNGKRITFKDQYLEDGTQTLKDGYGIYMTFNENGKKNYEAQHYAGRRAGKAIWYYDNGQIKESAIYNFTKNDISGLRWEIVSSFNMDGTAREKGTLKDGNGSWMVYDNNGRLTEVLEYKDGVLIK
jgi:antitoxin component YwqK of YwqJK toxin-antitoxin module